MHRLRSLGYELLPLLALVGLNAVLVWPLFFVEYPADFFSIEGAFIAIARHVQEHFGNLSWYPYWYGGVPFPSTYPPFFHALTAAWASVAGISPALAYHQTAASMYSLIPAAVYLLARSLRADRLPAVMAGLLVSLASPALILFESMANDAGGWRAARRLHVLIAYGEGPHLASILFALLALALLAQALVRQRASWFASASLACAATALSNWLGAAALAFGALAMLLTLEEPFRRQNWMRAAGIGVLAYAIAAPWMPPSTIAAIRRNAPFVEGRFETGVSTLLLGIATIVALLLALAALRAMGTSRAVRFALLWALLLVCMVVISVKMGVALLPQPQRYHIEMEIALLLALALAGFWFLNDAVARRGLALGFAGIIVLACMLQVPVYHSYARQLIQDKAAAGTIEKESAVWFAKHLPGQRIWLPGSVSFWASAFADVPQFAGAFDNGIQNPNTLGVNYQIYSSDGAGDRDGEIAVTWLKAYGVRAIQVSLPESPEAYHPFRKPMKFEGLLERIWEHRGMLTYRVPSRHDGLAFVIPEQAVPQRQPVNGLDTGEAERYVAALEDTSLPLSRWEWLATNVARIETALEEGQVLSVQVAHHPGWRAMVGDTEIPLSGDGLGQIVLRPPAGRQVIELEFTGGLEQKVASVCSATGLLIVVVLMVPGLAGRLRRRIERSAPPTQASS